jgi:hypothetical protein
MITRLTKFRYLRIAGFAVGAVAVAGAAVVITASASGLNIGFRPAASNQPAAANTTSIDEATKPSDVCNTFMGHLAKDLNVKDTATLNAKIQQAINETLQDQVTSKAITQDQANAIKQKIGSQPVCTLAPHLGKGDHGAKGQINAYMQQYLSAAASDLKANLAKGQTLKMMADAHKPNAVSEANFRSGLIAKLQPALDKAVTDHKLTTTQETAIINRLKTAPLPLWDKPLPHRPTAPATASPSTSQS